MEPEYSPEPGSVAQPVEGAHSIAAAAEGSAASGEVSKWSSNETSKRPLVNLLKDKTPAAKPAAVPVQPPEAQSAPKVTPPPRRGHALQLMLAGVMVLVLGGGGGFAWWSRNQAKPVAVATPTPTPTPTASPTQTPSPSPSPTATPTLTPTATPTPETVTIPAVTPTASHPQAVIVTSKSGLWLRSSATSVNRSNIIGWMPNGSQVSVDQVGDFWWHGTFRGQSGYFASKYTQ